ncbi:MAG: JAB domain-containing protein [Bacteroidales bacterium]
MGKTVNKMKSLTEIIIGVKKNKDFDIQDVTITSSDDSYEVFKGFFTPDTICHREQMWAMYLSPANKVIGYTCISMGGVIATSVDVKIILQGALLCNATNFLIAHNHPSGNNTPSPQDNRLTQKIAEAAKYMDMRFLDHIIVCEDKYYSYADEGKL